MQARIAHSASVQIGLHGLAHDQSIEQSGQQFRQFNRAHAWRHRPARPYRFDAFSQRRPRGRILHLNRGKQDEMTSNPRLLAQQIAEERQRFSELLFFFDALQTAADFAELQPHASGMENNPILRIGAHYDCTTQYFGFNWTSSRRKLELNVPLSEACHDNQLVKSFFNWERRQGTLPATSRKWRVELLATKSLIEARR